MCGCEPGFVCSRCRGVTMDDDRRLELEDEPLDALAQEEFEESVSATSQVRP